MNQDKSKKYRKMLGFSNQYNLISYFKAIDIKYVNWTKIDHLNIRLQEIFQKINAIIYSDYRLNSKQYIEFESKQKTAFAVLRDTNIIQEKFNNNGRSPENIYYNWMRGYLVSNYFLGVIAKIFEVDVNDICQFGSDNIDKLILTKDSSLFIKEAAADLEIISKKIHIEVQAGFSGKNDIKKSKAADASKREKCGGWTTYVFHFDLFNGTLAVIDITNLMSLSNDKWQANPLFEGVSTIAIDQKHFKWQIQNQLPSINQLVTKIE